MAKTNAIKRINSEIIIDDIGDSYVKVSLCYSNGETATKLMSFNDYSLWLLGAKEEACTYSRLPELPTYFYDGLLGSREGSFKVQLLVPAGKHQMVSTHFDFAELIPYPALLFDLRFEKGRSMMKDCYAVIPDKNGKLTDDSPLYRYPYGNVATDGGICMGNISVKCSSLTEAEKFCEEFFLGIDEGHYYTPKVMISKDWNLGKLYQEALKKDKFPNNWLVPNGRTYKDIKFK